MIFIIINFYQFEDVMNVNVNLNLIIYYYY
jgi:hypothetical protein